MLTAEATLPPVQPSTSVCSRNPDSQHAPSPTQIQHATLGSGVASSLQHPMQSGQPYCSSLPSTSSVTPDSAASTVSSHRAGVAHAASRCHCDAQLDTLQVESGNADLDSRSRIITSSEDVRRRTIHGSLSLTGMRDRHSSESNLCQQSSSASAILPTRQQQLAAICRLRKPLAVVTQKNSLIRYTGDGKRYWRWRDVVARVLHICRGASADDYSLLLQTEHWLEACDSKHRYGSNLKPYFKVWLESDTHQSFFKWLDEGQGLHVDINERPRSKLDADRVVYCGIERCFFEVTVVQGWFRYRISKRLVTTDSSRDQPPCPPNLGETMDSIRSRMLAPHRTHSPPVVATNAAQCSTPPLSTAVLAVPLCAAPPAKSSQDQVAAQDLEPVQQTDVAHGLRRRQSDAADEQAEEYTDEAQTAAPDNTVKSCSTITQRPCVSGQSTMIPKTVRTGRLSVDAASTGSVSARRPGLLTQEFNRAAGMPYAQGGDSMRGRDMVRPDLTLADSSVSPGTTFLPSPPSVPCVSERNVSPGGSHTAAKLPVSKSGSVLAGAVANATQGIGEHERDCSYPYHTDDRYAGGWLGDAGQLCMRRHGVNSMPSGLVHFPSLVSPSSRLFSREVGGSDDEDSLPFGRSLGDSSVDTSGGSSPASSSPRPDQSGAALTPSRRKVAVTCAAMPHNSIHGFPSMPRLGVASTTQPPMLRPPQRTLRFPSSSTTTEATHSTAGDQLSSLQPRGSQRGWLPSPLRSSRSAEMPELIDECCEHAISSCDALSSAADKMTAAAGVKTAAPHGQCKGWDILRESLRMRKLSQAAPVAASIASGAVRKLAQRRIRAPLDSVADVAHPGLVSNSAIPENLKLLDIVETVAAPGGPRPSSRLFSHVCDGDPCTSSGAGNEGELAAGSVGEVEVRDLADMLEERMVNTGQLVKVKTQAQLEQMLPCAPKVLSKDSCASKRTGLPGRKLKALVSVNEHGSDCNCIAIDRPSEADQPWHRFSESISGPQDLETLPTTTPKRDGHATDATPTPFSCEPATAAPQEFIASAKDGTAVLEKAREKWIYVWDMHSRLYINRKMPGRFHHSSFVAGGAVKAAGSIVVEDGVLKQLTTWSGHYRPRASDIALFLQWLESNHVDMTNVELLLVKPNKPNSKMNKSA